MEIDLVPIASTAGTIQGTPFTTTQTVYVHADAMGNLLTSTDGLGRTTSYTWDALNDQTSVTDPSGVKTTMAYDAAGNLLSRSTPLTATGQQATTTLAYDPAHPGKFRQGFSFGEGQRFANRIIGAFISCGGPTRLRRTASERVRATRRLGSCLCSASFQPQGVSARVSR